MITLNDISRTYSNGDSKVLALKNISFKINSGEMVAIIGKSGSGKSTLLNILGLLDKSDNGEYYIKQRRVSSVSAGEKAAIRNAELGFVVQDFALIEKYSVKRNIMIPLLYSKKNINANSAIHNVLELMKISDKTNTPVFKLSGGQKQRTAIARAIINDPDIILADEPTGALDSTTAGEIMELFKRLNKAGKTVIIVTHDKMVAEKCGRIIELADGEIISDTLV